LVSGSENIENFFQRTVVLVSGHLGTPVCSIYLYDETADELVLKATVGLIRKRWAGCAWAPARDWWAR
jgi:phosphotransferase system enzyme I (PtsP)